jgi:hypothetical protein
LQVKKEIFISFIFPTQACSQSYYQQQLDLVQSRFSPYFLQTAIVLFEKVGQPFEKVALPFEKVGLLFEKVALLFEKVGLPFEKVALPFEKVALPLGLPLGR